MPRTSAKKDKVICVCCGEDKPLRDYYQNTYSTLYNTIGKRVPFCKTCIQNEFAEICKSSGLRAAMIVCCAHIDVPFINSLYESIYKKVAESNGEEKVIFGSYSRQLQMTQYRGLTFKDSDFGENLQTKNYKEFETSTKLSKKDKQNQKYVITTLGYDPFADMNMAANDLKYCYNTLAGYCDADGIKNDGHKIQSCVEIVQNLLQIRQLDSTINNELSYSNFDEKKVHSLTSAKKLLQDSITKIVQDNNISSAYSKNTKVGENTLTKKMKKLLDEDFEEIRVNLFDIKTSEAMKQVADISNRSIMDQLSLDGNDYTQMLKEQREMIVELTAKTDELKEENRNLKNRLADMENKKS